jgi:hypothetical protein
MAIAAVQRKIKATAAAASVAIGVGDGWAAPTAGNLLVAFVNSDATVPAPTGAGTWSAGPSVVDGNGTYSWHKVATGTETTVTVSPSVTANTILAVAEYSGTTGTPFDVQNSSTIVSTAGTTTTATSVTTTQDGDLIVVAALLHGLNGTTIPSGPSWTNSFVNQLTAQTGGVTFQDCVTFYADLLDAGTAGSKSTSASWTTSCSNKQQLIIGFKAAAPAAGAPAFPRRPSRGLIMR